MKDYIVYHKIDPDFWTVPKEMAYRDYNLVARVKCETLNDAFRLTNHIDDDWSMNTEVVWFKEPVSRSTSVGDVILDLKIGQKYCVARTGFDEII